MIREQLPLQPEAPAQARRLVETALDQSACDRVEDARLLVSEIVTNAVRHSGGSEPILLEVCCDDQTLHVEVHDSGTGFEPRERTPDSPLGSGWGLHLLRTLSDDWGVRRNGGACVWFELTG